MNLQRGCCWPRTVQRGGRRTDRGPGPARGSSPTRMHCFRQIVESPCCPVRQRLRTTPIADPAPFPAAAGEKAERRRPGQSMDLTAPSSGSATPRRRPPRHGSAPGSSRAGRPGPPVAAGCRPTHGGPHSSQRRWPPSVTTLPRSGNSRDHGGTLPRAPRAATCAVASPAFARERLGSRAHPRSSRQHVRPKLLTARGLARAEWSVLRCPAGLATPTNNARRSLRQSLPLNPRQPMAPIAARSAKTQALRRTFVGSYSGSLPTTARRRSPRISTSSTLPGTARSVRT